MVPLDRALVSYYRLSIVTMSLSTAVWLQFTMQVFGDAVTTNIWGNGGPNWYHGVAVGQPYLLLQIVF